MTLYEEERYVFPQEQDDPLCGNCGLAGLWRESADVGVGIIYGPYGCPACGWSEDPQFDRSTGEKTTETGAVLDQFGNLHPPGCHCLLPGSNGCAMRLDPPPDLNYTLSAPSTPSEPVSPASDAPGRQDEDT